MPASEDQARSVSPAAGLPVSFRCAGLVCDRGSCWYGLVTVGSGPQLAGSARVFTAIQAGLRPSTRTSG